MSARDSYYYSIRQGALTGTLCDAHSAYLSANVFNGPSLHFHLKALRARAAGDVDAFTEYVYAVLASWGMHRNGSRGSKMREYADFEKAVLNAWQASLSLTEASPGELSEAHWSDLEAVFRSLTIMRSKSHLVAASKVMSHILPGLVAPIDREYTLRFLHESTNVPTSFEDQWTTFRAIHEHFFHPLYLDPQILVADETWRICEPEAVTPWHSSRLKLIDNLVIGACIYKRINPVSR